MELTRRELLKLLGVSAGAGAGGVWGASTLLTVPDELFERVTEGARIETWKSTLCSQCPGGCGIRVRLIDGIPVRVQGNPLYPINHGAVCPMAEAAIESLFHPKRLRQPLKRVGGAEAPQWERISWDEALSLVGNRLRSLRGHGEPQKLAMIVRHENELVTDLAGLFMEEFGSPNLYRISGAQPASFAVQLTQGHNSTPVYDVARSELILNFGADLLDEGPSPVRFNQLYAAMKNRGNGINTRIVHIAPYLSRTAANSSEWIPIKPGTMGALALGIAYVMIKDGSFDKEFIDGHTFGFRGWRDAEGVRHRGFRATVSLEYYPEKVSELTGVPASQIVELARDFGAAKSALAIVGEQALLTTNGLYSSWAIYGLNALKGNLGRPGGLLFRKPMPGAAVAHPRPDAVAQAGLGSPRIASLGRIFPGCYESGELIPSLIGNGQSCAIDTLILRGVDPLLEVTNREDVSNALERVPFLVSCTPFLNETTALANLVLPEPIFLERWEIGLNNPAAEFSHLCVQQPVIEPIHDTRHFGDFLLTISRNLQDSVGRALPWNQYEDFIKDHAQALFNSGEGDVVSETERLSWFEFLRERGFRASDYATFDEFWEVLLEKGGWWDPVPSELTYDQIFKNESGRFEFYSKTFQREVERVQTEAAISADDLRKRWRIDVHGDLMYVPHFEAPRFQPDSLDYPFHLLTYRVLANTNGRHGRLGLLQELSGVYSRDYWESWAEMNPETAAKFGIREGDLIELSSPNGRLVVKVRLLPTVMPASVVMPFGLGISSSESGIQVPVNPLKLFAPETERVTGLPSMVSTRVNVKRISRSRQEEWRAT